MREKPYMGIVVWQNAGLVKVKIDDNGVGMPMAAWDNPKESFGIKLIKILVKQIGGKCSVANMGGTTMELDIPYTK